MAQVEVRTESAAYGRINPAGRLYETKMDCRVDVFLRNTNPVSLDSDLWWVGGWTGVAYGTC